MHIYIGSIIPIFGFVNAGVSVRRIFAKIIRRGKMLPR